MAGSVLLGGTNHSWRNWIKSSLEGRDLIVLDPADAAFGPATQCRLVRNGKSIRERFIGSTDPMKAPHLMVKALTELAAHAGADRIVQLPGYRQSPLARQLFWALVDAAQPDSVIASAGFELPFPTPCGVQIAEHSAAMPPGVAAAQRKAQWIAMLERAEAHTLDFTDTQIDGLRFGSGRALTGVQIDRAGLDGCYAEACGKILQIITDRDLADEQVSRAIDVAGCTRSVFARPDAFNGLICATVKRSGDEFGIGRIDSIDFSTRRARIRATAIPPVPIPILRVGTARIDESGNELDELKPWAL